MKIFLNVFLLRKIRISFVVRLQTKLHITIMENKLIQVTDWMASLKNLEIGDKIEYKMKEAQEFTTMRTRCTRVKRDTEKVIKVSADGMLLKITRIA